MKIDIEKLKTITSEMMINDLSYKVMQKEYDLFARSIDNGEYDDFGETMEKAYFYKRVLSLLANKDMPIRSAIGLIDTYKVLDGLYEDKYEFIGDSDTDEDIYEYVLEYGYRMYDRISHLSDTPEGVFVKLMQIILNDYDEEDENYDD